MLGGEPFAEEIVMWWNFIGRSHEEIVGYRDRLGARESRFPPVVDRDERVMEAPADADRRRSSPAPADG